MTTDLEIYTPEKQREVLQLLGISGPGNHIQLLFKLAEHYQLDVLTKEIVLIPNKGPFIGVWGRLHIAHRSGLLDGLEMDDEWETDKHYCVRVIVWRKDMSHPAAKVIGRVGKHEGSKDRNGNWQPKEWPLEIARARGLRAGLGFAFSIHDSYDTADDDDGGDTWAPPPDERIQADATVTPPKDAGATATSRSTAHSSAAQPASTGATTPASDASGDAAAMSQPTTPPKKRTSAPKAPTSSAPPAADLSTGEVRQPPPAEPTTPPLIPDAEPPTKVVGGHTLAERIAIAAREAGVDDDETRHDIIYAATKGAATRGLEVTEDQAPRVFQAFAELAAGTIELRYTPGGGPTLVRPRRRIAAEGQH